MRICHVITRMIVGGAQENTLLSVRGQAEHGHEVTLVTGPSDGPEGKLLERLPVPGARIVEIPAVCRELNPRLDWQAYRELRRFFTDNRFDVVHTHSSKAGVVGRWAAWNARVPFVCHTVHGQAFHPYQVAWRNWVYIRAERFAARRCHHIFAVAQAMIDQCVAAGVAPREKYSVVYSGMVLEPYLESKRDAALRARLGIPAEAPVIGKIARIFELKGYEYLVQVAPAVVREFPEARFLVVGDGSLRPWLETEIERLGLRRNFVLAGLVPPADVPTYAAQMDLLVHLSLREGLPRTVVQALATGIPAVAFALDGTPEVIETDRTGYLAPPRDVEAVTQGMLKLLRDREHARRLGAEGQVRVRQQFDWRHMCTTLEAAYERGLKAQRSGEG